MTEAIVWFILWFVVGFVLLGFAWAGTWMTTVGLWVNRRPATAFAVFMVGIILCLGWLYLVVSNVVNQGMTIYQLASGG